MTNLDDKIKAYIEMRRQAQEAQDAGSQLAQAVPADLAAQDGDKMHPQAAINQIMGQMSPTSLGQVPQAPAQPEGFLAKAGKIAGMLTGVTPTLAVADAFGRLKSGNAMGGMSDPLEWGTAFLQKAGSPEQVKAWQAMTPKMRLALVKGIGGMRTARQSAFTPKGYDETTGQLVFTDVTKPGYYDAAGNEVQVSGRLLPIQKAPLASGQVDDITNLLNAEAQLNEVKKLFDPSMTGPIEAKLFKFSKATGIDLGVLRGTTDLTDDKLKLSSIYQSSINDYIKAITGAQMSEPEARRIMMALPDKGAADAAFKPAIDAILDITNTKLRNRMDVLETQDPIGMKKLRALVAKGRTAGTTKSEGNVTSSDLKAKAKGKKTSRPPLSAFGG